MKGETITLTGFHSNGKGLSATVECTRCLFTSDIVNIHKDGECEMCKLQDKLRSESREPWDEVLKKIKRKGEGKKYDCLIGISGGEDSSCMLYLAVKVWGLRPLVIHFNNRTNRPEADHNMKVITDHLNVNFVQYFPDKKEYEDMCDSLLRAGVPDADIVNDIAMAKLMYLAARENGIKYILNGHDFRNEGSSPKSWSLIDSTYLQSIYKKEIKNYPLYTIKDQIISGLLGIKQIRPYHYATHNRAIILEQLFKIGYKDYKGKHNENIYTAFVGNYLLPRKFKIDKRRTYLSAQIREGYIDKEYAKTKLVDFPAFNLDDLAERKDHVLGLANAAPIKQRTAYKATNFKKYRIIFWLLMKFKIVPYSFFYKYC
jgi:hypothetical protein